MQKKKSVAVIVPIYKDSFTKYEEFSFYHNKLVLEKRDIFLLGPKRLEKYLKELSSKCKNGYTTIVDDSFFDNSQKGNSRLMMSLELYKIYEQYDFLLICHFDAIVLKDNLDQWMSKNFDYIGAPRFKSMDEDSVELGHGNNGGLCLRKVDSCIKVLSETGFRYSKLTSIWKTGYTLKEKVRNLLLDGIIYNYQLKWLRPIIHEDIYWSFCVPERYKWFKNAPFEEAKYFAFEVNPKLLFESTDHNYPFGIHSWWKYDKLFCTELILRAFPDSHVPGVKNVLFKMKKNSNLNSCSKTSA